MEFRTSPLVAAAEQARPPNAVVGGYAFESGNTVSQVLYGTAQTAASTVER